MKFAEGLAHTDLVEEEMLKQRVRDLYDIEFHTTYMSNMRRKVYVDRRAEAWRSAMRVETPC